MSRGGGAANLSPKPKAIKAAQRKTTFGPNPNNLCDIKKGALIQSSIAALLPRAV